MPSTYRAAVEVVLSTQNHRLVLRDTLDLVPPFAGDLDAGLDGFGAGVHGQDHVVAEELGDELGEAREDIVVEGARAESQTGGLVAERGDQLGMAMALVDGGVGRQEVEVVAALGVPGGRALGAGEDDGERMVVMGGIVLFELDGFLGGRGVVSLSAGGAHVGGW